jgi:amidase
MTHADRRAVTGVVDTVGAFVGQPAVLAGGAAEGPLAGVSLAVKDVFDVAGTVTGAGNPTFANGRGVAARHADAVDRLVSAGATVVGKTVTDELAYSLSGTNVHHGSPRNVAAPGRITGGSSAGSAAAVAAGLCDLALGTDTGGSIRVPASYCGIIGWRPTHGAVGAAGIVHLARSFDTVGLLAQDMALLEIAAEVLLDGTDEAPSPVTGAVAATELMELVDGDARASVEAATASWGATVDPLGVDLAAAVDAFGVLQGREAWIEHGAWITEVHPTMGPGITARFEVASRVTDDEVAAAEVVRQRIRHLVAEATQDGRVIVGPAAASAAPLLDEPRDRRDAIRAATLRLTCLAGLAGAPVVVVPVADDGGLPLGVAVLGSPGSDRSLIRWTGERLGS